MDHNKQRAAKIAGYVTWLAEAFGRAATAATFKAYEVGLSGIDLERIEVAVAKALQTSKFMPTPAELRELCGEMKGQDRAVHAWMALSEAVVRHTGYRTVTFDDPYVNAAVRAVGGWEHVCQLPANEYETFLREKFLKAYASLYASGIGEEQAAPLIGSYDRENGMNGYPTSTPRVVATGLPPAPNAPRVSLTPRATASGLLTLRNARS